MFIDHLRIKRRSVREMREGILKERKLDKSVYKRVAEKYGESVYKDFRISASRIATCPYYDVFLSDEQGARYSLRGRLFEEALIDMLSVRNLKIEERNAYLFTRLPLEREIKGYKNAIVHGFVDAIMKRGEKVYLVEAKSTFTRPMPILRMAQLTIYLRIYERENKKKPKGLLVAYIESRDPPIGLREIEISKPLEPRIKKRIEDYILLAKSPLDKSLCEICPLKDRCEYRTGSPYQERERS